MKPVILIIAMFSFFTAFASCAPHRSENTADRETGTPRIRLTADIRPEMQQLFKAFMIDQEPVSENAEDRQAPEPAPKPSGTDGAGAPGLAGDEQFMAAVQRTKERKDDLIEAKSDALLGETLSGRVGPVREDVPESVLVLARSENRDRDIIFQAFAQKMNQTREEIARQYRIFMYRLSDDDYLLQDDRGRWVEKKELDLQAGDW